MLKEYKNITAIVGVMRDKNYNEVLAKTLPLCENVICVTPNVPRALPANELSVVAMHYCENVCTVENLDDALNIAKQNDNPTFVFGSLYLASQIRPLLKK